MVNAEKWGANNFYVLLGLPSQLAVLLKLCIMNTVVHFASMTKLISATDNAWIIISKSNAYPRNATKHCTCFI